MISLIKSWQVFLIKSALEMEKIARTHGGSVVPDPRTVRALM